MPRNYVEVESYQAASAVFGQRIAPMVEQALASLLDALSQTRGMAGSDEAGTSWAGSYDPAAKAAVAGMQDLGNASYGLAGLLEQSGFNHAAADAASTAGSGVSAADRTGYDALSMPCAATPPTASGGSSSPPSGWGIVQHAVGYLWPNGRQGLLRTAAGAWHRAASDFGDLGPHAVGAADAVRHERSPEVADAVRVCEGMQAHFAEMADGCTQLGTSCEQLAQHIDTAHSQIESELVSFLEWSAAIEGAGALFSVVSLGGSEAAAQAAEAARIVTTGRRIAGIIETLIAAARSVAGVVTAALARVTAVAERVRPLLGLRAGAAGVDAARALPAVAKDGEQLAQDGLIYAGESKAAEDALYARYLARMEKAGKTPKPRELWRKYALTIKQNKAVGDAYRDEVAASLGIRDGVDGWQTELSVKGLGRRFDIGNLATKTGYEVKSGTSPVEETMTQLVKDENAVRRGWTITWQLKTDLDPTLMARLQQLATRYPGRFSYVLPGGG